MQSEILQLDTALKSVVWSSICKFQFIDLCNSMKDKLTIQVSKVNESYVRWSRSSRERLEKFT